MKGLEAKFPAVQQVEWTRYLSTLPAERQLDVFPEFLNWLDKEGEVWSTMDSKSMATVTAKANAKPNTTLYSNDGSVPSGSGVCYQCNKPGHLKRNCPDNKPGQSGQGKGGGAAGKKGGGRFQPKHRKFYCPYCKDDSKRGQTFQCDALRKLDFNSRKQMLDANRDCEKCAGDCPKGNCQ